MNGNGLSWAAAQILGSRENQEDSFDVLHQEDIDAVDHGVHVLVLADGMGGHAGGEAASGVAVRTVMRTYGATNGLVTDRLRNCVFAANDAVADEIEAHPRLSGMGTTMVVAVASPAGLEWISVGDSPLWLYRDARLQRLNADHSMAPVFSHLVATGQISAETALADKRRNALRSAVCGDELALIDVSSQPVEMRPGDIVVLATDGIETLSVDELADSLENAPSKGLEASASEIVEQVRLSNKAGQDNTTLILCAPHGLSLQATSGRGQVRAQSGTQVYSRR